MTELAHPLDELDNFQNLKRRGPYGAFWSHGRLRRSARIAMGETFDGSAITVILRRVRDNINADRNVFAEPEEAQPEQDPMAVSLPPKEVLQAIGATACELPSQPDGLPLN